MWGKVEKCPTKFISNGLLYKLILRKKSRGLENGHHKSDAYVRGGGGGGGCFWKEKYHPLLRCNQVQLDLEKLNFI